MGNRDTSGIVVGGNGAAATLSGVVVPTAGSTITVVGAGLAGTLSITASGTSAAALGLITVASTGGGTGLTITTANLLSAMAAGDYTFTLNVNGAVVTLVITTAAYSECDVSFPEPLDECLMHSVPPLFWSQLIPSCAAPAATPTITTGVAGGVTLVGNRDTLSLTATGTGGCQGVKAEPCYT